MWKHLLAVMISASALTANARTAIDVNQASAADLDGIKGIGPGTSTRILEARQQGRFTSWSDLITRVKGIGPGSAARLSAEGVTVEGLAYPAKVSAPVTGR